jgi:hypothetical protein
MKFLLAIALLLIPVNADPAYTDCWYAIQEIKKDEM